MVPADAGAHTQRLLTPTSNGLGVILLGRPEESFKAMLKKLEAVQVKPANRLDLSSEELELLVATAEYALANCPVEGIMTEDGHMASRELFRALREKLESFR